MKKVKVAEATGPVLDWMVAKAEEHSFVDVHGRGACRFPGVQTHNKRGGYEFMPLRLKSTLKTAADADYPGVFLRETRYWCPSIDWSQGGPIIEREHISVSIGDWDREIEPVVASWAARNLQDEMEGNSAWSYGPAPLLAAMRCYVASKLGDEVEVPEELG